MTPLQIMEKHMKNYINIKQILTLIQIQIFKIIFITNEIPYEINKKIH